MHSFNVQTPCTDFICIKTALFCVAIILFTLILTLFWPDHLQTANRSPRVVHSLPRLQSMQCFDMCVQVPRPDGLWVPQNSRTVWGVTQSAECKSQASRTPCKFTSNGKSKALWELWVSDRVSSKNRRKKRRLDYNRIRQCHVFSWPRSASSELKCVAW